MYQPLADLLRPTTLDEVYGQEHILGPNAVLRRLIDSGKIPNNWKLKVPTMAMNRYFFKCTLILNFKGFQK